MSTQLGLGEARFFEPRMKGAGSIRINSDKPFVILLNPPPLLFFIIRHYISANSSQLYACMQVEHHWQADQSFENDKRQLTAQHSQSIFPCLDYGQSFQTIVFFDVLGPQTL